jgi:hypothetical protein
MAEKSFIPIRENVCFFTFFEILSLFGLAVQSLVKNSQKRPKNGIKKGDKSKKCRIYRDKVGLYLMFA